MKIPTDDCFFEQICGWDTLVMQWKLVVLAKCNLFGEKSLSWFLYDGSKYLFRSGWEF